MQERGVQERGQKGGRGDWISSPTHDHLSCKCVIRTESFSSQSGRGSAPRHGGPQNRLAQADDPRNRDTNSISITPDGKKTYEGVRMMPSTASATRACAHGRRPCPWRTRSGPWWGTTTCTARSPPAPSRPPAGRHGCPQARTTWWMVRCDGVSAPSAPDQTQTVTTKPLAEEWYTCGSSHLAQPGSETRSLALNRCGSGSGRRNHSMVEQCRCNYHLLPPGTTQAPIPWVGKDRLIPPSTLSPSQLCAKWHPDGEIAAPLGLPSRLYVARFARMARARKNNQVFFIAPCGTFCSECTVAEDAQDGHVHRVTICSEALKFVVRL